VSKPCEFSSDAVATSVAQMRADRSGEIHSVWRIEQRFIVLPGTQPSRLMCGVAKLVRIVSPRGEAA